VQLVVQVYVDDLIITGSDREGLEEATRGGGEWKPIKIPPMELGLYPKIDLTPFSSNLVKTAQL
jgi:hypothetical protein